MNTLTILEKVALTFAECEPGTIFLRDEIIHAVHTAHGINRKSIIPSGYCYNRTNLGKQADSQMSGFYLFEYLGKGRYKYWGKNYPYTGKVYHHPKGTQLTVCVGEWINGSYSPCANG